MNTESKTFRVPNIGCDGCVRTIINEVSAIEGVTGVRGDAASKTVVVEWGAPATWDAIYAKLVEIEYAPETTLMP